jgi:hypothetical protein
VTVSFENVKDGRQFNVPNVWTGTVTANEVVLNVR